MITREWLISGRVQGVGFRYFVKEEAIRLALQGYVENLPDGKVRVLVRGEKDTVEKFLQFCKEGPPASRVEGLKEKFPETSERASPFNSFLIRY